MSFISDILKFKSLSIVGLEKNTGKTVCLNFILDRLPSACRVAADFSDFSEKNIEREGECITIVLPDPKVTMTSSKVDQKNIRQYVALTRSDFSDAEMTSYQEQGRAAIIADIPKMGILEKAQQNAAKVLVPMLTELGYKEQNITIAFRKQYNSNDIVRMIEEL